MAYIHTSSSKIERLQLVCQTPCCSTAYSPAKQKQLGLVKSIYHWTLSISLRYITSVIYSWLADMWCQCQFGSQPQQNPTLFYQSQPAIRLLNMHVCGLFNSHVCFGCTYGKNCKFSHAWKLWRCFQLNTNCLIKLDFKSPYLNSVSISSSLIRMQTHSGQTNFSISPATLIHIISPII